MLTLEQLGRGERAGERIASDLVPKAEVVCTLMHCSDSACCNGCGGAYGASLGDELRVRIVGVGSCTGMDCNYRCEPFGIEPSTRYRFVGKNAYSKRGQNGTVLDKVELTVEKYCLLSDQG